ncbi:MAG: hypothetical protein IIY07_08220, partial [Thermoguttaceae bacterium]|nr:hypothetical protein [Thermoguttaceae bacterium]
MKRRSRYPVLPLLLAAPILTSFDAFATTFRTFAVGQIAAQEPIATDDEDGEIDFQLVAPGEFDLAPDDAPTLEIDADADRPAIPLAVES